MKKIDWDKVWKETDQWFEMKNSEIGWRYTIIQERRFIQSLVEAQLKPKRKK